MGAEGECKSRRPQSGRRMRVFLLCLLTSLKVTYGSTECGLKGETNRALDVYDVTEGDSLKAYLDSPDSGSILAKVHVINGTHWITAGGGVRDFGLVLGQPPATSSDTTLRQAMEAFNATTSRHHKILIDYEQPNLMELILQNVANFGAIANAKLWVFQPLDAEVETDTISQKGQGLSSNEHGSIDVSIALRMPDVGFGLDKVFSRVLNENYLLPFDYARIKKALSDVFSRKEVESNEVLYLKRKAKVVTQRHRNSFTELYLSNIVHLLAGDNAKALQRYRKDPLVHPLIFMPDLQQTDSVYTRREVQQVEDKLTQLGRSCVILEARGGVFSQNESLRNIQALMSRYPGLLLLVRVDPWDAVSVDSEKLVSAIRIVGADRVMAQLPDFLREKMQQIDGSLMITPPRLATNDDAKSARGAGAADQSQSRAAKGGSASVILAISSLFLLLR